MSRPTPVAPPSETGILTESQALAAALVIMTTAARVLRARLAQNGVTGPNHYLDFAERLSLSPDQIEHCKKAGQTLANQVTTPLPVPYTPAERQLTGKPDTSLS